LAGNKSIRVKRTFSCQLNGIISYRVSSTHAGKALVLCMLIAFHSNTDSEKYVLARMLELANNVTAISSLYCAYYVKSIPVAVEPPREERGMLVLRRKAGEAIVLNQVIVIRVLGVEGDRVKLGIDAPPDVIVVREELLEESSTSSGRTLVQSHVTAESDLPHSPYR
jgi:carbon storage regulator